MKIKNILKNQKVRIDSHGHNEVRQFNDNRYDIHLHKETNDYKYDGKKVKVEVRVPLNSNRPIDIRVPKGTKDVKREQIEKSIIKEIRDAFSDESERKEFVNSMVEALTKDYQTEFPSVEEARKVASGVFAAFGIEYQKAKVREEHYVKGRYYSAFITDSVDGEHYHFKINKKEYLIEGMNENDFFHTVDVINQK